MTIDTLNEKNDKDSEKYNYTGQSHHSLAHAYYTNNYSLKIVSNCSPQVYDILTSGSCMNSPFFGILHFAKTREQQHMIKVNSTRTYW